ncbi:MAG TPA: DUF4390 domain-containing protein [Candidatus Eisenbacteria bacterium]|nr:DUF4390 domain-containing protein [Candidatus Eisenbacteria bacterium]
MLRTGRTWVAAWVLALALLAITPRSIVADDLGLEVDPVADVAGAICVSYRVAEPFTPRLEETLQRGMPATVSFEVGLWKRRPLWFDKLVLAIRSDHKIVYDDWRQAFRIRSGSNPPRDRSAPSFDALRDILFTQARLPLATTSSLDPTATYYASVRVTIKPVAPEDLGEIEDWLAGDKDSEQSTGLPDYLLGLAVSLSGLGERTEMEKGPRFVPARLSAAPATSE